MAKCEKKKEMAKCEKKQVVTTYNLELTEDEAKLLAFIMYRVGGSSQNSPRKHADSIRRSLAECNIGDKNENNGLLDGFLIFKDDTNIV
jgi:hypothetical protein